MYLLHIIVFISGASALIFENLWLYCAGLTLGNSVWAAAIVLASFMSGLAIGNALSARFEALVTRPLRTYMWLEVAIGISGCLLVVLFPSLTSILTPLFRIVADAPWLTNLIRLAAAFGVMLIPTAAMGATLPILAKHLARTDTNFGKMLGGLYGANTLGSVGGLLLCETVLIPAMGVVGSAVLAAVLNLCAAGLALVLSRSRSTGSVPVSIAPNVLDRPSSRRSATAVLVSIGFLTGGILLALEVVWFRFLLLFFDAYSLNFAIMLALVLVGIGVGGVVASAWFRRVPTAHRYVPLMCFLSGVTVIITYGVFHSVQAPLWRSQSLVAMFCCASVLILPTALLSGIIFTMLANALHRQGRSEGSATGIMASVNTLGATGGALLASFLLLPAVGMERSFLYLAVGYAIAGALPLCLKAWRSRLKDSWPIVAGATLFGIAIPLFPYGMMHDVYLAEPRSNYQGSNEQLVAIHEGQTETSQYLCHYFMGQPEYYRLVTNNHSMAATDAKSRRYMKLYAYFPFVLQPSPQSAALICFGVGTTAKALTEDRRLEQIDIIDISKDILRNSRVVYPDSNANPLFDKRVRIHREDGRFFLQTTRQSFDIITAEPPPPFFSGVTNLYSREYFRLTYNRLNPGGMVTYWLPVDGLRIPEAQAIVRAFTDVFANATLWTGSGMNWMLVGIKPPVSPVTDDAFRAWWNDPMWKARFADIGIDSPEMLGATFIADAARLKQWANSAAALTDNFPRRVGTRTRGSVEEFYAFFALMNSASRERDFDESPLVRAVWPDSLRRSTLPYFGLQSSMNAMLSERAVPNMVLELHNNIGNPTLITMLFWRFFSDFGAEQRISGMQRTVSGREKGVCLYQAQCALREERYSDAADWLARAQPPRDQMLVPFQIYLLYKSGRKAEGSAMGRSLYESVHTPGDRQGIQQFMNWMENEVAPHASNQ